MKFQLRRIHPKLLYVPGIISLVFLLPSLLIALNEKEKSRLYALEVIWTVDDSFLIHDSTNMFSRNFVEITLSGNQPHDKTKLDFAAVTVEEISSTFDTVRGLKIIFNDSAKYESFIHALNMCERHPAISCIPSGDHIWIFNRFKSKEQIQRAFFCGTTSYSGGVQDPPVSPYTKEYIPLFSILIVLSISSVISTTRSFLSRK